MSGDDVQLCVIFQQCIKYHNLSVLQGNVLKESRKIVSMIQYRDETRQ